MVEKVLTISAKLAAEEEMPGKLFAIIEETVLCLSIYIGGYSVKGQADMSKALALSKLLTDHVMAEVLKEKDFGNMIMAVDLLRLVTLLQSSYEQPQSPDVVSPLTQLLAFCHKEVMAEHSDQEKDMKDWLGVACGALATMTLIPTGMDQSQVIMEFF